jgi:hypothetical protein
MNSVSCSALCAADADSAAEQTSKSMNVPNETRDAPGVFAKPAAFCTVSHEVVTLYLYTITLGREGVEGPVPVVNSFLQRGRVHPGAAPAFNGCRQRRL